jgi:predicted HTH transcriptional regulator
MLALGESGRYEFKSAVNSVTSSLFATLANWVALDPEREVAHLLVGVNERTDEATGLVYGEPCGLPKGLDRAVERIQNVASETRPIPVDIFIIEEAVKEAIPFVRVEVRPTMPPHFDGEGCRQTRIGRSTRALTDDELLRIYLDREAGSFAARFRQTADELHSAVGTLGTQVDQIAGAIEQNIARPISELTNIVVKATAAASSAAEAAT